LPHLLSSSLYNKNYSHCKQERTLCDDQTRSIPRGDFCSTFDFEHSWQDRADQKNPCQGLFSAVVNSVLLRSRSGEAHSQPDLTVPQVGSRASQSRMPMTQVAECGSRSRHVRLVRFARSQHRAAPLSTGCVGCRRGPRLAHDSYPLKDRSVHSKWICHSS